MQKAYTIQEISALIAPIARKYGVKRVAVFGSVARGEAHAGSDVDLCIDAGEIKSLVGLVSFRLDAEEKLQTSVDVVTTTSSDREFLNMIQPEAVTIYEQ